MKKSLRYLLSLTLALYLLLSGMIMPKTALAASYTVGDATSLAAALKSTEATIVIDLTSSFTYYVGSSPVYQSLSFDNKDVTFNLNGNSLTLDAKSASPNNYVGACINLYNNSTLRLLGEGKLNVISNYVGVNASGNSTVDVTNVTTDAPLELLAPEDYGVRAYNGATINVRGDVKGDIGGVYAYGGRVTVGGDVIGVGVGVLAEESSTVVIGGSVYASSTSMDIYGVRARRSTVTVKGNIILPQPVQGGYIRYTQNTAYGIQAWDNGSVVVDGRIELNAFTPVYTMLGTLGGSHTLCSQYDYLPETTKSLYRTYSDGNNTVWVREIPTGATPISYTLESPPAPKYTITIPSALNFGGDPSGAHTIPITIDDITDLGERTLAVTFDATQHDTGSEFRLDNLDAANHGYAASIEYTLLAEDDTELTDQIADRGTVLATFSEPGTKNISFVLKGISEDIWPDQPYTGYIVFGIKVK